MSDRRSRTHLVLSDKGDAFNFHIGAAIRFSDPKRFVFDERGELVEATRWQRLRFWLEDLWLNATRWFRPRTVAAAVDRAKGEVTMANERWSWRRWRWERTP